MKDVTGIIQITAVKGKVSDAVFKNMSGITRESVILVSGKIATSKQAPGGKEIIPDKVKVLNMAEDLPIDVSDFSKTELPKRDVEQSKPEKKEEKKKTERKIKRRL